MEIKFADFITSAASLQAYAATTEKYPADEVCFVGRSNVGKSSFINMLCRRNKLAKTSSLPGRTRLINLFDINEGALTFVDLPGYGYAAASKTQKKGWGELIEGYLTKSEKLKRIFLLVDSRSEATALDKQMINYMHHFAFPFTVIATKCDKLSRSQIHTAIMRLSTGLTVGRDDIVPVSSQTGFGRDAVLKILGQISERE